MLRVITVRSIDQKTRQSATDRQKTSFVRERRLSAAERLAKDRRKRGTVDSRRAYGRRPPIMAKDGEKRSTTFKYFAFATATAERSGFNSPIALLCFILLSSFFSSFHVLSDVRPKDAKIVFRPLLGRHN